MSDETHPGAVPGRPVRARIRGLSDRAVAWIFIGPTVGLLLAVNIFPRIRTVRLSLTNNRCSRAGEALEWVGIRNCQRILTGLDTWSSMQATVHFLLWTLVLQVLIGFALAYLIDENFRGRDLETTITVLSTMLSPAVVGNFRTFLYQAQIGLFDYVMGFLSVTDPASFSMIGDVDLALWSIVIVDTSMWTPFVMLICPAGLRPIPDSIYGTAECDRASAWRQF